MIATLLKNDPIKMLTIRDDSKDFNEIHGTYRINIVERKKIGGIGRA